MNTDAVNWKNLIKLIRKSTKDTLVWQRTEEHHYIASSHWMIKVKLLNTDTKAELYKVFGREVPIGERICWRFGKLIENANGLDCSRLHSLDGCTDATLTPIVVKATKKGETDKRIVRLGDHLTAISSEYAELANGTDVRGKDVKSPIYFGENGEVLIMPYVPEEGWEAVLTLYLGNMK